MSQRQNSGCLFWAGGLAFLTLILFGLFSGLSIDDAKSGVAGKTFEGSYSSYMQVGSGAPCYSLGRIGYTVQVSEDLSQCEIRFRDGSGSIHSNVSFTEADDDILLTCSGGSGKFEGFVKDSGGSIFLRTCFNGGVFKDSSCSTPLYCVDFYETKE